MDWQTPTALGIVAITVICFGIKMFRRHNNQKNCGHSCDCGAKTKIELPIQPARSDHKENR